MYTPLTPLEPSDFDVVDAELDPDDPANDRFVRTLNGYRLEAEAILTKLTAKRRRIALALARGASPTEAAKEAKCAVNTVYTALQDPRVQRLVTVNTRAERIAAGPSLSLRKAMIWRIAHENEATDPRTALAALKELNSLAGDYPAPPEAPPPPPVVIKFEHQTLAQTPLDALPPQMRNSQGLLIEHDD